MKDSKTCIGTIAIVVGPTGCPPPPVAVNTKGITSTKVIPTVSELKIQAYPNPSVDQFTLALEANSNEKVVITVTDLLGRKVYQAEGDVKKQYIFGNDLKAGIYILQVVQGNDKQSTKLIKE